MPFSRRVWFKGTFFCCNGSSGADVYIETSFTASQKFPFLFMFCNLSTLSSVVKSCLLTGSLPDEEAGCLIDIGSKRGVRGNKNACVPALRDTEQVRPRMGAGFSQLYKVLGSLRGS